MRDLEAFKMSESENKKPRISGGGQKTINEDSVKRIELFDDFGNPDNAGNVEEVYQCNSTQVLPNTAVLGNNVIGKDILNVMEFAELSDASSVKGTSTPVQPKTIFKEFNIRDLENDELEGFQDNDREGDAFFSQYETSQKQVNVAREKEQTSCMGNSILDSLERLDSMTAREFLSVCSPLVKKTASFMKKCAVNVCNERKVHKILKKFEKGATVESGKFTFAKSGSSLMLMKYSGVEKEVIIPATVGGLPVQFLHPDFLVGGVGVFNNYRVRGITDMLGAESPDVLDTEDVFLSGFEKLILPNTITMLFKKTFLGCRRLSDLCIPESVYYLSDHAFYLSRIKNLYFNGPCPKGFSRIPDGISVFVREEHKETYRRCSL